MKQIFRVTDKKIIYEILEEAQFGTLALAGDTPYGVPLNFALWGEDLCFHGSQRGKKMEAIRKDGRASFCVVVPYSFIPSYFSSSEELACPATQFFKSVAVEGHCEILSSEEEKREGLRRLMKKHQPEGGYKDFSDRVYEKMVASTAVFRLKTKEVTAKFKFGQHLSEERFHRIVENLEKRGREEDLRTAEMMRFCRR